MQDLKKRQAQVAETEAAGSDRDDHLRKRIEACLAGEYTSVNLSVLSVRLGYSRRHMSRIVRKLYAMSFPELLNARRVRVVQEGLDKGMPLKQAVTAAGYTSVGYYRRVLKKQKGS